MQNKWIADTYHQIGSFLRALGADKIILLSASVSQNEEEIMELELAVDGYMKSERVDMQLEEMWPEIQFHVIYMDEKIDEEVLREILEDGIKL